VRPTAKVTIDRLWEVIYEKSIGTKMNGFNFCLEVVLLRSCKPLGHIRRWLSRKPLEIEAWFQMTTNRKWPMGNQIVTRPMKSRDPEVQSRDPNTLKSAIWPILKSWKQLEMLFT